MVTPGHPCAAVHDDALAPGSNVVLVDDLLATGGTMEAGMKLMTALKCHVVECQVVIELPALKGREKLAGVPVHVLIQMEGE